MNIPIEIAEKGGEALKLYIEAMKEYNSIDLKRDKIETSIDKSWQSISELMEDYLILKDYKTHRNMYEQSIGSRHLVDILREKNPIMTIYEIEEHLKSLRHLLLDERETAIRKEELEKELLKIRNLK